MDQAVGSTHRTSTTVFAVLGAASLCHLLNDLMQSVFLASYPIFKSGFDLDFGQIGLLTLAYQAIASLLQPFIGQYTDRRPLPFSMPFGMASSMAGLLTLALAPNYPTLLAGALLLGIGSSIFHPETSRLARLASGGAHGLAQSIFQVGGNTGTALGPLMVALLVLPRGRGSLAWFALAAATGIVVQTMLGFWYRGRGPARRKSRTEPAPETGLSRAQTRAALAILVGLMLSKFFYLTSITSYYVFYLMHHFRLPAEKAQLCLFVFLASVAVGTLAGGPIGDRIGRKKIIWLSILGVLPFTLPLPYVSLPVTIGLSVVIGLALASAFPSIVVYAQELMPGRIGMVSGLFFGLAFGLAGVGAALLGQLADWTSIDVVYRVCSFLPALGLLAAWLPDIEGAVARARGAAPLATGR